MRNQLASKVGAIVETAGGADVASKEQLKRMQDEMNRKLYRELMQGYFRSNPDERSMDLIQTLDFYGKKFALVASGTASLSIEEYIKGMALQEKATKVRKDPAPTE